MIFFPSTLVINGLPEQISELISNLGHGQIINNPDILQVTEYTIASIREINKFLANRPLSHDSKIILIADADKLNFESQNALLKNLEEPGKDNYFILTTTKPYSMLSTIVSRCHLIRHPVNSTQIQPLLTFPQTIKDRLLLSEQLASDRVSTTAYLESQLESFQKELVNSPSLQTSNTIKKILKSINLIKANIDPKTALDFLMLS
jgi:replication-associated recombination protein RarA